MSYRAPRAIVCCLSATAVYGLTDQLPSAVQIAVPGRDRPPRIDYPPIEVFRFAFHSFDLGFSRVEAGPGKLVRAYGTARTMVDVMRLRHRLGEPVAYAALYRYLERLDARPGELLRLARSLGVYGPLRRALDVASARCGKCSMSRPTRATPAGRVYLDL